MDFGHSKLGGGKWRDEKKAEDSSWAESTKRYMREKTAAPEMPANMPQHRQYRDGRFNKKVEEREYDLILHKYRDEGKEVHARNAETDKLLNGMVRAKDRALRYESPYDVINHDPKLLLEGKPAKPEKPKDPPPADIPPWMKHQPVQQGTKDYYWPNLRERSVHLINNRYLDRPHEETLAQENNEAHQRATEAFYATNHYNPVTGTFFDPQMEAEFQRQRVESTYTHGIDKYNRLPISIKQAAGNTYNIVAPHIVYNPEIIEREANQTHKVGFKYEYEDFIARNRQEMEERELRRAQNKCGKGHLQTHARGYDIITTVPYYGRRAVEPRGTLRAPDTLESGWKGLKSQQQQRSEPVGRVPTPSPRGVFPRMKALEGSGYDDNRTRAGTAEAVSGRTVKTVRFDTTEEDSLTQHVMLAGH